MEKFLSISVEICRLIRILEIACHKKACNLVQMVHKAAVLRTIMFYKSLFKISYRFIDCHPAGQIEDVVVDYLLIATHQAIACGRNGRFSSWTKVVPSTSTIMHHDAQNILFLEGIISRLLSSIDTKHIRVLTSFFRKEINQQRLSDDFFPILSLHDLL